MQSIGYIYLHKHLMERIVAKTLSLSRFDVFFNFDLGCCARRFLSALHGIVSLNCMFVRQRDVMSGHREIVQLQTVSPASPNARAHSELHLNHDIPPEQVSSCICC